MKIRDVRMEVYEWPMTKPIRNGLYTYKERERFAHHPKRPLATNQSTGLQHTL